MLTSWSDAFGLHSRGRSSNISGIMSLSLVRIYFTNSDMRVEGVMVEPLDPNASDFDHPIPMTFLFSKISLTRQNEPKVYEYTTFQPNLKEIYCESLLVNSGKKLFNDFENFLEKVKFSPHGVIIKINTKLLKINTKKFSSADSVLGEVRIFRRMSKYIIS